MSEYRIDINCDLGESYGNIKIGNDEAIFPFISSCNIACGFHGGDAYQIEQTLKLAKEYNTRIGAHPSYPDLENFGRTKMILPKEELKAIIKYQVSALKGMTECEGLTLKYVKPHGALYNVAADDAEEAECIVTAIKEIDVHLALMGLAGSEMELCARRHNMHFIPEAFGDRRYNREGRLVPRGKRGAVIHDPEDAINQIIGIIKNREVISIEGIKTKIRASSICIHGDNSYAIEILTKLDKELGRNNIIKTSSY
jgi:UPF0271 protein